MCVIYLFSIAVILLQFTQAKPQPMGKESTKTNLRGGESDSVGSARKRRLSNSANYLIFSTAEGASQITSINCGYDEDQSGIDFDNGLMWNEDVGCGIKSTGPSYGNVNAAFTVINAPRNASPKVADWFNQGTGYGGNRAGTLNSQGSPDDLNFAAWMSFQLTFDNGEQFLIDELYIGQGTTGDGNHNWWIGGETNGQKCVFNNAGQSPVLLCPAYWSQSTPLADVEDPQQSVLAFAPSPKSAYDIVVLRQSEFAYQFPTHEIDNGGCSPPTSMKCMAEALGWDVADALVGDAIEYGVDIAMTVLLALL